MKVTERTYEVVAYNQDGNKVGESVVSRNDEDYLNQLGRKFYAEKIDVQWHTQDGYERDVYTVCSYEHGDYIGDLRITTWQRWG